MRQGRQRGHRNRRGAARLHSRAFLGQFPQRTPPHTVQFEALLTVAYRGPPPASEVQRMMDAFDTNADGKVTLEEFKETVKAMKAELEAKAKRRAVGAEPIQGRVSLREMHDARKRHIRDFTGPKDTLHHPITGSQDIGWTVTEAATAKSLEELHPKKKCPETVYAEKMYAAGEYF